MTSMDSSSGGRTLRASVRSRKRPAKAQVPPLAKARLYFDEFVGWRLANFGTSHRNHRGLVRAIQKAALPLAYLTEDLLDAGLRQQSLHASRLLSRDAAPGIALVLEVIRRVTGLSLRPNQIECALRLLAGDCVELRTGEGKTLAAGFAACIAARAGVPVHVITVNDYLATRDGELVGPIAQRLGLSLGVLVQDQSDAEKSEAYDHDIVYGTNKTFVFDALRDRREAQQGRDTDQARQMGQAFAIVDEADSVLIDDATVPMILSEPTAEVPAADVVLMCDLLELAATLKRGRDTVQDRHGAFRLTEDGIDRLSRAAKLWVHPAARDDGLVQVAESSLAALHSFSRDVHYLVQEGEISMIDQATGRLMPDRKWAYGLQQMIEMKEGLEPTAETRTVGQITQQTYFRRYLMLSGLTGTARECRGELWAIYRLVVGPVAPNTPSRLRRLSFRVFPDAALKWQAVAVEALGIAQSRAVLIGVNDVAESAALAQVFADLGREVAVLDAMSEAQEADLVAGAGQAGRITIATHLAGRGTDIGLTEPVRVAGGLHVILASAMSSGRLERQLYGRAGRQGDPGSYSVNISQQDRGLEEGVPRLLGFLGRMLIRTGIVPRWALSRLQAARDNRTRAQRRRTLLREQDLTRQLGYR